MTFFKPGPQKPDCNEMVQYLLKTDGYFGKTHEELMKDRMLNIVASACEVSIENVVEIVERMIKSSKTK